jgi:hypothetical protein
MTFSLFAWTTRLPDGSVSLVGAVLGGFHTPLIASRQAIAESMKPIAKEHSQVTGQPVFLERFDYAENIDTIRFEDAR